MSAEDAKTASLLIDLPDCFPKKKVPVASVVADDRYTFAGPCGSQIAVSRELTPWRVPNPAMVSDAAFKFVMKPWNPLTVLRLQAVDEDYRVWRGKALLRPLPAAGETSFMVFDRVADEPKKITVPSPQVVRLSYGFGNSKDDAYYSEPWRNLPFVSGGGVGLLTYVGCGDAREYGNALGVRRPNLEPFPGRDRTRAVPFREANGSTTLSFDGCSFASIPVKAISSQSGFSISMRIMPLGMEGEEGLLDSGNLGFCLYLDNGVPKVFLSLMNFYLRRGIDDPQGPSAVGPKLRKGEWTDLKVNMDQQSLWIEVNGVAGERVPCSGYGHNPAAMAFGVKFNGLRFFRGRLASLSIDVL